jgi:hypothetical protein
MPFPAPSIDVVLRGASGPLGLGQSVILTLDASQALTVDTTGGVPSLLLSNGGIATYDAAASAAAGSDKLVFSYTVAAGQDANSLQVSALELNGATIIGPPTPTGFTQISSFNASSISYGLAQGDLDGDGRLDVVVSDIDLGRVSVLLNDGMGGFGAVQSFAATNEPMGVALGDVNGDGKLDVVTGSNGSGQVAVLLGDGTGQLGAPQMLPGFGGMHTSAVGLGDVTGDGKLDLVVSGYGDPDVRVLAGDGAGNFGAPQVIATGGSGAYGLTVADVNNDGKLDILVGSYSNDAIQLLAGDGAGNFAAPQTIGAVNDVSSLHVADVTGDGKVDIVAGGLNGQLHVLDGHGNGSFDPSRSVALGPTSAVVMEMTGDALPDLITAGYGGEVRILAAQAGAPGTALDLSTLAGATDVNTGLVVDASRPALAGLSLTLGGAAPTQALRAGDVAVVTVSLGEAVTLSPGGEASLTLSNGAVLTDGAVGTDGQSLVFDYEVSATSAGTANLGVTGLSLGAGTTLRDTAGNDAALSSVSGQLGVAVDHPSTGAPDLAGNAVRGEVLHASLGSLADADGLDMLTYRWQRDDGHGGWTDIVDAHGDSFTLGRADIGHAVRAVAEFTDEIGVTGTAHSAASAIVAAREMAFAPPSQGLSDTRTLTYHDVQARIADGDVFAPPAGLDEVRLADGTLSFGAGTDASFLTRLYGGALGRTADASGLTNWSGGPGPDIDRVTVANGFLNSAEYGATHEAQTDAEFVQAAYHDFLFRAAETEGLASWEGMLAGGGSRAQVLAGIADSDEARDAWSGTTGAGVFVQDAHAGLIRAVYQAALGREAEAGGLAYHADLFQVGLNASELARGVASSQEFAALHGGQTDAEFVQSLYTNALGRAAAPGEGADWEALLANGAADRAQLVLGFVNSAEGQAHLDWVL